MPFDAVAKRNTVAVYGGGDGPEQSDRGVGEQREDGFLELFGVKLHAANLVHDNDGVRFLRTRKDIGYLFMQARMQAHT